MGFRRSYRYKPKKFHSRKRTFKKKPRSRRSTPNSRPYKTAARKSYVDQLMAKDVATTKRLLKN